MNTNENTRIPVGKKANPPDNGNKNINCPKCKGGILVKSGFTTNHQPKQRYLCRSCGFKTTLSNALTPSQEKQEVKHVQMRKKFPAAKYYIITAAQNATPIHKLVWQTILRMRDYYKAELVVPAGRYKNPTSQWTQNNKDHEWWDEAVMPYLCDGSIKLSERLIILGDTKIQWAARSPLVGMDALTKDKSGIVGHGSRGLRSIATPQHEHPKIMLTTGTCTIPNYTDTKQGKIAQFNHCLGGLIVEVDGDTFYVRQLDATKQGHIIDLDVEFTPDEVRPAKRALSVSMGDTHQRWVRPDVVSATLTAPDSLVKMVNPQYLFWHDLIDFHSRNHHHNNDWITNYLKWKFGIECVRQEVDAAIAFVNEHTSKNRKSVIVSSNHDRAVAKWLKETDFKHDPVNAEHYLESSLRAMRSGRMTDGGVTYDDPFVEYVKMFANENVQFLKPGESKVLSRVEYSFHGDIGPNGSKGTTKNLSNLGVKVTKGHSHTAEIIGGCYSAGKSTGMLEYENGGPSSHTNAHVLQYANGKRTIIFFINGRFCLPRPRKNK